MGRKRINDPADAMPARFRTGTLKRIDAVLEEREKRSDLLREAVEHELRRREQKRRESKGRAQRAS
jgi:hypothetical protein